MELSKNNHIQRHALVLLILQGIEISAFEKTKNHCIVGNFLCVTILFLHRREL